MSNKNNKKPALLIMTTIFNFMLLAVLSVANAEEPGKAIEIGGLSNLLWSIVKTIQLYTLPVMAIVLAFLGIRLIMSGDDSSSKADIKSAMVKVLIGCLLVFSAASISEIIKNAIGV